MSFGFQVLYNDAVLLDSNDGIYTQVYEFSATPATLDGHFAHTFPSPITSTLPPIIAVKIGSNGTGKGNLQYFYTVDLIQSEGKWVGFTTRANRESWHLAVMFRVYAVGAQSDEVFGLRIYDKSEAVVFDSGYRALEFDTRITQDTPRSLQATFTDDKFSHSVIFKTSVSSAPAWIPISIASSESSYTSPNYPTWPGLLVNTTITVYGGFVCQVLSFVSSSVNDRPVESNYLPPLTPLILE